MVRKHIRGCMWHLIILTMLDTTQVDSSKEVILVMMVHKRLVVMMHNRLVVMVHNRLVVMVHNRLVVMVHNRLAEMVHNRLLL